MENHITHVRKNTAYSQLSAGKQHLLSTNSPYTTELTDADLESVYGGRGGNVGILADLGNMGIIGSLLNPNGLGNPENPGASNLPKSSNNS
jgi:hypothetical protein